MLNIQSRVQQTSSISPTLRSRLLASAPPTHQDTAAKEINLNEQFLSILRENRSSRLNLASDNESIIELAGTSSHWSRQRPKAHQCRCICCSGQATSRLDSCLHRRSAQGSQRENPRILPNVFRDSQRNPCTLRQYIPPFCRHRMRFGYASWSHYCVSVV